MCCQTSASLLFKMASAIKPKSFTAVRTDTVPKSSSKRPVETATIFPPEFAQLEQDGYQVIPAALNRNDAEKALSDVFDMLEGLRPLDHPLHFDRNDPATYRVSNVLQSGGHGVINNYGIGHQQFLWDIRQLVEPVFRRLYRVDADDKKTPFWSSFDGMCIKMPPEYSSRPSYHSSMRDWFHFDQGPRFAGRHCTVQGFVALTPSSELDATLVVLAGSHHHHAAFFSVFKRHDKKDFVLFNEEELKWLLSRPGVRRVAVPCKPGDLLLWNSLTAHCNKLPTNQRPYPRMRIGAYVCMKPAHLEYLTNKGPVEISRPMFLNKARKRLEYFYTRRTTSHNPLYFRPQVSWPMRFGKPLDPVHMPTAWPKLTPAGLRLAGFGVLTPAQEHAIEVKARGQDSMDVDPSSPALAAKHPRSPDSADPSSPALLPVPKRVRRVLPAPAPVEEAESCEVATPESPAPLPVFRHLSPLRVSSTDKATVMVWNN